MRKINVDGKFHTLQMKCFILKRLNYLIQFSPQNHIAIVVEPQNCQQHPKNVDESCKMPHKYYNYIIL